MEKTPSSPIRKPINFIKGHIKELKDALKFLPRMNNIGQDLIKNLLSTIDELYDISHRSNLSDYIYIFSRRQKAMKCMALLDSIKNKINEDDYQKAKDLIKHILLENWSQQILPQTSGIIKSGKLKTELYLNLNTEINHNVLEQREYIGIDPEAKSDLDAPSIVTAMTPPHYEQPIHNHENNWEITFYTGHSIGKYYDQGTEYPIEANFGDFIIFPPKTYHTIKNPNSYPVRNISIKLPSALLDRGKHLENIAGSGKKESVEKIENGIYFKSFPSQNVPYKIYIYNFSEIVNNQLIIKPDGKSVFYILDGDFICQIDNNKKNALSESDVVIAHGGNNINFTSLHNDGGKIYRVTLIDDDINNNI